MHQRVLQFALEIQACIVDGSVVSVAHGRALMAAC